MLPKKNRLLSDYDYRKVRRAGIKTHSSLFSMSVLKTENPEPRFGIVTSKRLDKRAVVRNRARRILTEAIRGYLSEIKRSVDVVLVVKIELIDEDFEKVCKLIVKEFKKAGVS